jgi:hypothetical protein
MFRGAPFEAQLLALLVTRHPGLVAIVGAQADFEQRSRDNSDYKNGSQSHGNLPAGFSTENCQGRSGGSTYERCRGLNLLENSDRSLRATYTERNGQRKRDISAIRHRLPGLVLRRRLDADPR